MENTERDERDLFEEKLLAFETYLVTLMMYSTGNRVPYTQVESSRKSFLDQMLEEKDT